MKPVHYSAFFLAATLIVAACAPASRAAPTATEHLALTPTPIQTPTLAQTATARPTTTPTATRTQTPAAEPTSTPAASSAPLNPEAYTFKEVASGFGRPLFLTHAGDGSGRLFVVEQRGRVRIIQDGQVLPDPFLDISEIVRSESLEQGLLGLAFHPDYAANGLFFVNYTDLNGDTVVARYAARVSAEPNRADPASARILLQIDQPYSNHNGGDIAFGPEGYLYIGMGDGGSQGDPHGNGQNLDTLLGKLLRIDVNQGDPYSIPPDNPFVGHAGARPEIWAYGLRNPWRFSFDRATGDLYIGDVGQRAYEEVNLQPAGSRGGENYGWNFMEGQHPFEGQAPAGLTPPIAEYAQSVGGCSVIGGYVYRGENLPGLKGVYLYGDWCSGLIWALYRGSSGWESVTMAQTPYLISSFGEDEAGELYVLDHAGGGVYQMVAAP